MFPKTHVLDLDMGGIRYLSESLRFSCRPLMTKSIRTSLCSVFCIYSCQAEVIITIGSMIHVLLATYL
ncbi:hypothetical protein CPB86DRAFT_215909 [Serendipita vermifera]|nr:hypothetical protein CPB86DRAFT_215909 [Serendipita vermifera]